MQWDIFCRVIDNFGDIGVSWRLSADLATRGHKVRLWVDDPSALVWMAPGALQGQIPGIEVLSWSQSTDPKVLSTMSPSDVWIEAFGCEIAPEFIAAYAASTGATGQKHSEFPVWINLEYLSAESYVERNHGLASPVLTGPARGATKYFFYPGFTSPTGGLLREPGLLGAMAAFDAETRAAWLKSQGILWHGERLISLFCYKSASLTALIEQLQVQPEPVHLVVTAGLARSGVSEMLKDSHPGPAQDPGHFRVSHGALTVTYLPALSQANFDRLLWACDANFVRGEDSVVRALWAGKPFVWQIYPQDDGAHHAKLDAFMDSLGISSEWRRFHRIWNGVTTPESHPEESLELPLQDLRHWAIELQSIRQKLLAQTDLLTQLVDFAEKKR